MNVKRIPINIPFLVHHKIFQQICWCCVVEYLWKENRRGKEKVRYSGCEKKKSSRPDFLTGSGAPNRVCALYFLDLVVRLIGSVESAV